MTQKTEERVVEMNKQQTIVLWAIGIIIVFLLGFESSGVCLPADYTGSSLTLRTNSICSLKWHGINCASENRQTPIVNLGYTKWNLIILVVAIGSILIVTLKT